MWGLRNDSKKEGGREKKGRVKLGRKEGGMEEERKGDWNEKMDENTK